MILSEKRQKIDGLETVANICNKLLKQEDAASQEREHVWVVGLNNNNVTKYIELVSLGTADRTYCVPRDIYRLAVQYGCMRIIMVHNHPGGSLDASYHDKESVKNMAKAGDLLGIQFCDSIIITDTDYLSIMHHGAGKFKGE